MLKTKTFVTCDSRVVPHRSTEQAQGCLTSEFGWDPVLSPWYERMMRADPGRGTGGGTAGTPNSKNLAVASATETASELCFSANTAAELWFAAETHSELWFSSQTPAELWFVTETASELCFSANTASELWFAAETHSELCFSVKKAAELWFP